MEAILHYVWKYRLYDENRLFTTDGIPVSVLDPGIHNTDAGPDFFNAKIKIGDELWAGNVEIHSDSSDWVKHGHHQDPAYNSVILHVVEFPLFIGKNTTKNGRIIPELILKVSDQIRRDYEFLISKDTPVACIDRLREISPIYLSDWLNALLIERLERKMNQLSALLSESKMDWNVVFYITLCRNFGFGINSDAFEQLARSLPLKYLMKHNDSILSMEAMIFGQAGLLEKEIEDEYYQQLQSEYDYLRKKYNLKPVTGYMMKFARIRPGNFPHIKIAQLTALIRQQEFLFSKIIETEDIGELRQLFVSELHTYWQTHYHFGQTSVLKSKKLGPELLDILLINTVVPILFVYGTSNGLPELSERAVKLLEKINPEKNTITNLFRQAGVALTNAVESQALIQLKKEYCDQKKCIYCRIGHQLLSNKT